MYVVYVCIYCIYCILYVCSIIILDTAFKFDLELSLLFRIIVSMETKETGIAQWVESRQIPDDLEPVMVNAFGKDPFDKILKDYEDRIKETKRKIESLITKELDSDRYKTFAEYQESDLNLICSAIGVYTISGGVIHKCHRRTNYPGPDITTCLPISDYDIWYDYLGEQTRIREIGGNVIVMLSNEGVEYLNDIANRVSSYTTTTV